MLSLILNRRAPVTTRSQPSTSRLEVRPPLRRQRHRGWLHRALACIPGLSQLASRADRRLLAVSSDFVMALADVRGTKAVEMRARVRAATSMRDLWHLRTAVHHIIAMRHGEAEADIRLAYLSRHFPTRNPRSGFGSFDTPSR